jgi:signal transduction histidine kinase
MDTLVTRARVSSSRARTKGAMPKTRAIPGDAAVQTAVAQSERPRESSLARRDEAAALRLLLQAPTAPLLSALVESAPIAIAMWDIDGRVLLANVAMRALFEAVPPPEYSIRNDSLLQKLGYLHYVERAYAGETVHMPTFWYDPRELTEVNVTLGKRVAISVSLFPLFDETGSLHCVAGLFRDDTQITLAQERLRTDSERLEQRVSERTAELAAANRELESFSYSVSHDLRTPLRAIDGYAARLIDDPDSKFSSTAAEYLQRIRGSAQRMGELINDLLTFARFGRQTLTLKPVETRTLIEHVLQDLEAQIATRGIQIDMGELPSVQADPILLREVFLNLLDNAVKFTGQRAKPIIEIGCQVDQHPHVWYVRDNGIGFDMDHAGQLFGVFTRLHSAQDFEGTGVGLALVQRIVQRHGGDIWAQAQPDRGATFYFTLGS